MTGDGECMKATSVLLFGALVVCVFALMILWTSLDFQQCVKSYGENDPAADHLEKGISVFIGPFSSYRHCIGAYVTDKNAVITALGTLVIAVFTTVLGIFTMSLAKSTRSAADAALLAAQASIGVELPHVFIDNLEFQHAGVGNLAANLQFPRVAISVKNYGRTPAFLGLQGVEMLVAPTLPETPDYSNNAYDLPSGTVIEGGATYDLPVARLRDILPIETIEILLREGLMSGFTDTSFIGTFSASLTG
jgi:hypothetical protein